MSEKDVRICGYFWKPRGICKQTILGNTALGCAVVPRETQAVTALNFVVVVVVLYFCE